MIALEDTRARKYRKLVDLRGRIVGAILLGYPARGRPRARRDHAGQRRDTAPGGTAPGTVGGSWRGNRRYAARVLGGMKPRIRTTPPRVAALALAAGVAALALPGAASAAANPSSPTAR